MRATVPAKRLVKSGLRRLGVLEPTYRIYERLMAATTVDRSERAPDGLPLPPAYLRVLVAGTADAEWFLERGAADAKVVADAVAEAGASLEDVKSMLDFGCGCGRVVRHWHGLRGTRVHGCDHDSRPIEWCRGNLAFAEFEVNGLTPPLPYEDCSFDLVYALSVFTHLTRELQFAWRDELGRILRPAGHLVFSTAGSYYVDRLTSDERRRFGNGELIVRYGEAAGTNLCAAYHPRSFVVEELAGDLEHVAFIEGHADGAYQDVHVLRRLRSTGRGYSHGL